MSEAPKRYSIDHQIDDDNATVGAWMKEDGDGEYALYADLEAANKRVAELEGALEESDNKLRAHDGLVALKKGIPVTTGDAEFDEVLRMYPVAEMIQRQWLGSATGFDDLPFLKKQLLHFFDADDLKQLLDPDHLRKQFCVLATPDSGVLAPKKEGCEIGKSAAFTGRGTCDPPPGLQIHPLAAHWTAPNQRLRPRKEME